MHRFVLVFTHSSIRIRESAGDVLGPLEQTGLRALFMGPADMLTQALLCHRQLDWMSPKTLATVVT